MTEMKVTPEILLAAYAQGFFPMAPDRESEELDWYKPLKRGIIPLQRPVFPRRLMKTVLSGQYRVMTDRNFDEMIDACSRAAPGREETWISPGIKELYGQLHKMGHAHSVEVRHDNGALVGGLYGVTLGGAFFGESMVSFERDTSKIALVHLIAALHKGGYFLLDTQFTTPHLARLGGIEIEASSYQALLMQALGVKAVWPQDVSLAALEEFIRDLRHITALGQKGAL